MSRYRALIRLTGGPSDGSELHMIRDDAEASLCGIPRPLLGTAGGLEEVICADCLDWFEKRRAVSGTVPKIRPI
jgi:hypothetical protein